MGKVSKTAWNLRHTHTKLLCCLFSARGKFFSPMTYQEAVWWLSYSRRHLGKWHRLRRVLAVPGRLWGSGLRLADFVVSLAQRSLRLRFSVNWPLWDSAPAGGKSVHLLVRVRCDGHSWGSQPDAESRPVPSLSGWPWANGYCFQESHTYNLEITIPTWQIPVRIQCNHVHKSTHWCPYTGIPKDIFALFPRSTYMLNTE